ncbi:MAG: NifB/NifX family molybdenum-iron cluster-binding protein [Chitinispirillaceae bacterium]|nr:NifB/NifX family molybdenum-iron cluster-binding protein [Chitinispirillaceae bacterium]
MKIAVTAQGTGSQDLVDSRFGRGAWFIVYDTNNDAYMALDNKQNLNATQGAGIQSAATVVNAGCEALITGHCGPNAFAALTRAGTAVYTVSGGTVAQAIEAFKRGDLKKIESADVEGHW